MKTIAPFSAAFATLILLALASRAFAGPLEDADAANKRADYAAALKLISPLAEQGDAGAQRRMGDMYASGRAVTVDYTEAEKWFQKAAAQGTRIYRLPRSLRATQRVLAFTSRPVWLTTPGSI